MVEIKDIDKLAELSRITLTDQEKAQMRAEIESVLGYINQIQKVSGTPKTPAERALDKEEVRNILREDVPSNTPDEYTEALIANAPKKQGRYVKVKKILQ